TEFEESRHGSSRDGSSSNISNDGDHHRDRCDGCEYSQNGTQPKDESVHIAILVRAVNIGKCRGAGSGHEDAPNQRQERDLLVVKPVDAYGRWILNTMVFVRQRLKGVDEVVEVAFGVT